MVLSKELGIEVPEGITGMQADILEHPLRDQVVHQTLPLIDMRAAGTNHFSWILSIHDRRTGEDLYPLFRERFASFDPNFEPLTRRVFDAFGLFPVPGDTHLCEYLPWLSDPVTKPWDKYNVRLYDWDTMANLRDFDLDRLNEMSNGNITLDGLLDTDSEGALEMIENIAFAGDHYHLAANLPNVGQIPNLPMGTTVETPVYVDGAGIHPVHVGALPESVAELCRRELAVVQLCIDSAIEGSYQKALQCLLLDPVITDIETARQILDDYLETYRQHLPQFHK
jgi:alpha-galactosidase